MNEKRMPKKINKSAAVRKNSRKLKSKAATSTPSISLARLNELIEEAIVDAYGEEEQTGGFLTMLEDNLALPFSTNIFGAEAVVEKIDLTNDSWIVAVCRCGKIRQRIGILDLPLPTPAPAGAEWIAAYRHWRRGFE
jgi:Calcium binding